MVKFFHDNPTNATRAVQIWQILVAKASSRETLTYGELAKLLKYGGAGTLSHSLGHIMYYCQQNGLPPLTVIVVNKATGSPGDGLDVLPSEQNSKREEVFQYPWFDIIPPDAEELKKAVLAARRERNESENC